LQQNTESFIQATILAVGHFSSHPQSYGAHPFVVSGSCKHENALSQKKLLDTACTAINGKSGQIKGRLYSITSDGDSRRRQATAMITMAHELDAQSPLRQQLGNLRLFNYRCGADDITADIDYKHVLKRFRNTLLRSKGITMKGIVLTQQILKSHLLGTGRDEHRVNAILSPNDKQDIKLAYDLLSVIADLPLCEPQSKPAHQNSHRILRLLGQLYSHLLDIYTNINLSLHDQLLHLSAAAHLVLALYSKEKGGFMPSQLYYDFMTMAKNAYFCVAKTQLDDPKGSFWLILLGTDALETLFGKIRTMVGSDSNADQLQLANRAESAAICSKILAEHPDWERAPRRIKMKAWRDESGDISAKVDHINPATWRGDVKVENVVLLTSWQEGRRLAEKELKEAGYGIPFEDMDNGNEYDILCPFGSGRVVLIDRMTDGEQSEEVDEDDITTSQDTSDHPSSVLPDASSSETALPEPDLEDLAAIQFSQTANLDTVCSSSFDPYVQVEAGNAFKQHKSTILRLYSDPLTTLDSKDRLKRVRGYSRYNEPAKNTSLAVTGQGETEPQVSVEDPVALLVRSKDLMWLSVAQVVEIKCDGLAVQGISTRLFSEPNVKLKVQIMRLVALKETGQIVEGDWEWTGQFERLAGSNSICSVESRWVQLLDPSVISSARDGKDGMMTYAFQSQELMAITALLYNVVQAEVDSLPCVPWSDTFPYRTLSGEYYES
jgi:hypothetical protein